MSKPNKNNGCLWFFVTALLSLFFWVVLVAATSMNSVLAAVIAIVFSVLVSNKLLGRPGVGGLIIGAILLTVGFVAIRALFSFLGEPISLEHEEVSFKKEEGVKMELILEADDSVNVYTSHRIWKDNFGNSYAGDLMVRERDYLRLKDKLNSWNTGTTSTPFFWGNLYDYLEQSDSPSLDLVMQAFTEINKEKSLNQMEFAEMVVTCIQDIPYSFIFQEACLSADEYEPSIRRILEDCPECCMGNVPYGIQNPVSFLKNLKGDCDTRTVLIYAILKHFDYDVAILNSEFYRHSILGLNLPASGINKRFYGKRYVVWETTAKHYPAGRLPSNFSDITHWNVVLTSK